MKVLRIGSIIVAGSIMTAVVPIGNNLSAKPHALLEAEGSPRSVVLSVEDVNSSSYPPFPEEKASTDAPVTSPKSEDSVEGTSPVTAKPADVILESLRDVPIGTPLEEIKRASDAFSVDFTFMRTVAKIESFASPRIIAAIVDGTAPPNLTVTGLANKLPCSWGEQERGIGLVR